MFGVGRPKSLRRKGRFFGLSLHHGFFALGMAWWPEVAQAQRLQDSPRVGAAPADSSPFGLIVEAEGHQAERRKRLQRPLGREIHPCLLEPAVKQPLDQQCQCSYEDMCFYAWLDLMINRPHRQHILERAKPTLDIA